MKKLLLTSRSIGSFFGLREHFPAFISKWVVRFSLIACSNFCLSFGTLAYGLESQKSSRIEDLKAQFKANPKDVKIISALAQGFFDSEDYEKASALLWENIEKIERQDMLLLIKAHEKRNEQDQILKAIQILLSKRANDAEALTLQGRAYLSKSRQLSPAESKRQKLPSLGLESLKKALEADPKYVPAYEEIAKIYDRKDKPNFYELRLVYQDMIEKIGPKHEFFAKLCKIDFLDGVNDPAIESCNKAIQLDDSSPDSHVYLGLVYRQIGENEKGIKILKEAAKKFPKSLFALESYAKSMSEEKNFIEAFKFYEQCLLLNKQTETCLVGAGVAASELQKFEKSLNYLKLACDISYKNAVVVRRIASQLKTSKLASWLVKFENLANTCSGGR
jgi:tetratricopeptide (TPR) repeat protein